MCKPQDVECRNVVAKDEFPGVEGGARTLYEVFENSVKKHGDKNCLGWRPISNGKPGPYEYWTYNETRGAELLISMQLAASLSLHQPCSQSACRGSFHTLDISHIMDASH